MKHRDSPFHDKGLAGITASPPTDPAAVLDEKAIAETEDALRRRLLDFAPAQSDATY